MIQKHRVFLTTIIGTILLCSCGKSSNPQDKGDKEIKQITLSSSRNDDPSALKSFFKYQSYIPLETNDNSLLQFISKIQLYKGNFYLLDYIRKRIQVFDTAGNYVRTYNHLGGGPGEYVYLSDFSIRNDTLYLLGRDMLLSYSLATDSLLQTRRIDPGKGLYVFPDDRIALNKGFGLSNDGNSHHSYAFYHGKNKVFEAIPFNPHLSGRSFTKGEGANCFYTYDDTIFTLFPYNDTIYTVNPYNGKLAPYLSVSMPGRESIEPDDNKQEIRMKIKKGNVIPALHAFYKWGKHLFFIYTDASGQWKYILTEDTGRILYEGYPRLDDNFLPYNIVAYDSDENRHLAVSLLRPENIGFQVHAGKSKVLDEMAGRISVEDNPILVFYEPTFP